MSDNQMKLPVEMGGIDGAKNVITVPYVYGTLFLRLIYMWPI